LKQLFYIQSGESSDSIQLVLCLRIGERHCSFAITDKSAKELYHLGYYTDQEVTAESIGTMFMAHPELSRNFYSVQVGFDHPQSILIPFQFYNSDSAGSVVTTMYGNREGCEIMTESVKEWQLYNVYAINRELKNWVGRKFSSASCQHNYSVRIKLPAAAADRLLVDVHLDEFSVVGVKGNKLVIAQTYQYSSPADILYYLLKICEQYSFSQRETEVCIAGLIERESALFRDINQYFLNASFREPLWHVSGMEEQQYPSHFFTPLNDLARCVS
jgi:hypothetical protein